MSIEEMDRFRIELEGKNPALYSMVLGEPKDSSEKASIRACVEDFLGRVPCGWDYGQFRLLCLRMEGGRVRNYRKP